MTPNISSAFSNSVVETLRVHPPSSNLFWLKLDSLQKTPYLKSGLLRITTCPSKDPADLFTKLSPDLRSKHALNQKLTMFAGEESLKS